jgi:hypothetical protein
MAASKPELLAAVVAWLHNGKAEAQSENFWSQARERIAADVWGLDTSVENWDTAHASLYPSLWFNACLVAGNVWAQDSEAQAQAEALYGRTLGAANSVRGQGFEPANGAPLVVIPS